MPPTRGPRRPRRKAVGGEAAIASPASTSPDPSTLPELVVEWMPDAAPGVVDGTWESMTPYCTAWSSNRGRQYELDQFQAGQISVTLETFDRLFDPENTAGAYYGKLKPMRQIRISLKWQGVTYRVARGYITSWGQTVEQDKKYVTTVSASDGFERLERIKLPSSAWALEVQKDNPSAWFRLGESDTVRITDSSPNGNYGVYDNCQQGQTGLVVNDSDGAASFAHSLEERAVIQNPTLITGYPFTISAMIEVDNTDPAGSKTILSAVQAPPTLPGSGTGLEIVMVTTSVSTPGRVYVRLNDGTNKLSYYFGSTSLADNKPHHIAVTYLSSTTAATYVDGALSTVATSEAGPTSFTLTPPNGWVIGNYTDIAYGDYGFGSNADGLGTTSQDVHRGTIDEVCFWNGSAITADRIAAHALAAKTGWADETTGARVTRFLDAIDWPVELRDIDDGISILGPANWSAGASALSVMQTWADTELGQFFMGKDGKIVWRSRHNALLDPASTDAQAIFGDAHSTAAIKVDDMSLVRDATLIRNPVTASRANGVSVTVSDTELIEGTYGDRSWSSPTTEDRDDASVRDRATWLLNRYKEEATRAETIKVNPRLQPTNWPTLLNLELGNRIATNRTPLGTGPEVDVEQIVEQINWTGSGFDVELELRGSPVDPNVSTLPDVVTWYGAAGTFGSTLPATTRDAQGYPLTTKAVWANKWPTGQSIWFPKLSDDGSLILPCYTQNGNVFTPTGTDMQCGIWADAPTGALTFLRIPTSNGSYTPVAGSGSGAGVFGGSSFEGVTRFTSGGVEHFALTCGRPYLDWNIATYGVYPCVVVLTKVDGAWAYDAGLSKTATDLYNSNPTAGAVLYTSYTTGVTGESNHQDRHPGEIDTFPVSGHMVFANYDDATGAGYHSGGLSVIDTNLNLKATYLVPNVSYPTGHQLHLAPRNVRCDPSSTAGAEHCVVTYDVYDDAGSYPAGLYCNGAGIGATTPDAAAWDIAGIMRGVLRLRLPDYTPSALMRLVGHSDSTSNQRSWALNLNTDGTLNFVGSNNGTGNLISQNSSAPGLTDYTEYWIGWEIDTAGGVNTLKFYKANAAEAMPALWAGWTLISQHNSVAITFFGATCRLAIGAQSTDGTSPTTGDIYRFALYDDGVLVADANFAPDGSPLAVQNASTYTDSTSHVWTVGGGGNIIGTAKFMFQVFTYNSTTSVITPLSPPMWTGTGANLVQRADFDADGNLYVPVTSASLTNATMKVWDKSGGTYSFVTAAPAIDAAWAAGAAGSSTQWRIYANPDHDVTGTNVGSPAAWLNWDAVNSVMYVVVGTSGIIAIQRSGTAGAYSYTYVGTCGTNYNDAPGVNPPAGGAIIDTTNRALWTTLRQNYSGSYPSAGLEQKDQWIVAVRTQFWDAPLSECRYLILDDAYAGKLDTSLLAY